MALWLSFREIDWALLWQTLLKIDLFWVGVSVLSSVLIVYALGIRWRILLRPQGEAGLYDLFRLNIISQCANIIVPVRLGDVLRIYLASKRFKISGAHVTGTVVIEKALDFFVFVILWVLVPPLFAIKEELQGYGAAIAFSLLTLMGLILFIWRRETILKLGKRMSRILPSRFRDKFVDFFDRSLNAFALLKDSKLLAVILLLTVVFVGGQIITNYFLFLAFGFKLSIWVALLLLLALQVGNMVPSSPGKVGVFEVVVIYTLKLFDIPETQALGYGLVLHLVAFLPKILLGLVYISQLDISLRKKYSISEDENKS